MNITRQQQVLSLIKRIVSTELLELNHELFHTAAVTDVQISNDGSEARIWVDAPQHVIEQLNGSYRSQIQRAFMKKFTRKRVPILVFCLDTGDMNRMDALLDQLERNDND